MDIKKERKRDKERHSEPSTSQHILSTAQALLNQQNEQRRRSDADKLTDSENEYKVILLYMKLKFFVFQKSGIHVIELIYCNIKQKLMNFRFCKIIKKKMFLYFLVLQNYGDDNRHGSNQDEDLDIDEEHAQMILERYSSQNVREYFF